MNKFEQKLASELAVNIVGDTGIDRVGKAAGLTLIDPSGPAGPTNPIGLVGPADGDDPDDDLTSRQLELLALLSIGFSNHQLALALSITDSTVEVHLHRIYRKLGVTSRVQAARYAWTHKITWEYVQKLKKEKELSR